MFEGLGRLFKNEVISPIGLFVLQYNLIILSSTYNAYTRTLSLINLRILLQQGFRQNKLWWTLEHVATSFEITGTTYYSRALLVG